MQYFTPKFWQMTVGFLVIVSMALAVTLYVGKKHQVSTTGLTGGVNLVK